ncbi:hypothetical protein SPI_06321 [Niveomyces insectorum RCEF 264]|uniref:Uncharacterized protein n=1 Tax=Niveomyces insectorum RCEF 264 TaxID=1081102 RepID=A0A167S0S1_9HYPO|nr:hypothetical protein SPI_06321 [Niveomyces insectorum RCEF 264]
MVSDNEMKEAADDDQDGTGSCSALENNASSMATTRVGTPADTWLARLFRPLRDMLLGTDSSAAAPALSPTPLDPFGTPIPQPSLSPPPPPPPSTIPTPQQQAANTTAAACDALRQAVRRADNTAALVVAAVGSITIQTRHRPVYGGLLWDADAVRLTAQTVQLAVTLTHTVVDFVIAVHVDAAAAGVLPPPAVAAAPRQTTAVGLVQAVLHNFETDYYQLRKTSYSVPSYQLWCTVDRLLGHLRHFREGMGRVRRRAAKATAPKGSVAGAQRSEQQQQEKEGEKTGATSVAAAAARVQAVAAVATEAANIVEKVAKALRGAVKMVALHAKEVSQQQRRGPLQTLPTTPATAPWESVMAGDPAGAGAATLGTARRDAQRAVARAVAASRHFKAAAEEAKARARRAKEQAAAAVAMEATAV